MKPPSLGTLLRLRLEELSPRDTFELGMYRLLAWADTDGTDQPGHDDRLADWGSLLQQLGRELSEAATR